MSYTREQEMAVRAGKSNMLVTAAAGAGKTHVLTGRIIGRLTDPEHGTDVDRLLVVTFTKAAAAEMRERIEAAITKEMDRYPESQRLARQLSLLPNASINTIDAFCQRIVREYFYRLELSPSFQMMDPADEKVLRAEALEETMEALHKEADADFLFLAESYSGARSDETVGDMILSLFRQSESLPFPEDFYARILAVYEGEDDTWCDSLAEEACALLSEAAARAQRAADAMNIPAYANYFADAAEVLRLAGNCETFEELGGFLENRVICGDMPIVRGAEQSERDAFKYYRKTITSMVGDAKTKVCFQKDEALERMRELAPAVRGLVKGARRLSEECRREKARRNAWAFSDVERMCLELFVDRSAEGEICPSEVAQEIRERYDEIYIDEYQDSNDIQEWIFRLISGEWVGEPNMFMVGDLKQSIYRFRHCNPALFRRKKETYSADTDAPCRKLSLSKNFRSRQEVVDGVNVLFRALMSPEAGEVEYDASEELVFGAPDYTFVPEEGNGCELLLVEQKMSDALPEEEIAEELSKMEREAVLICRRIRELLESGFPVYDKEEKRVRPIEYRDIAVLMRGNKEADLATYVFDAMGIPLSVAQKGGYYDSLEVRTFLALLGLLDNARQDIPLAAVLRSAMVGMWEADLAEIHLINKRASLYDNLLAMAEREEGVLAWKCRTFLQNLARWRRLARRSSMDELVSTLLEETGWYAYVGALPGGEFRQANLRAFRKSAAAYDNHAGSGLFSFIGTIEKNRKNGQDEDAAGERDSSLNVVKLLTIHKSKGLEFPVVFLSSMGKEINQRDAKGNLIIHPTMGLGLNFIHPERKIRYGNPYREAVATAIRNESVSEELRILYVAATRAREKLIITATVPGIEAKKEVWEKTELTPAAVRKAKTFMDWIGPAVMQDETHTFSVQVFPGESLYPDTEELPTEAEAERELCRIPAVEETLSYQYPFQPLAEIPPLFTVTELKGMAQKDEEDTSYHYHRKKDWQRFSLTEEKEGLSPMEKGSVNHFVMQHIDVREVFTAEDVRAVVKRLCEKALITPLQAEYVDVPAIEAFLKTPLAARMRRAEKIYRESPFMMSIPCREVPGIEHGGDEKIVVQGIVDCWFEDEDGFVVLDYKTDRTGDVEEIKKRYQVQMDLYEKALSLKILKKSSEKFIYLFYNGSIIEM